MNEPEPVDRRGLFLSALLMSFLVLITGGMAVYVLSDPRIEQAHNLLRAALAMDEVYHGTLDWEQLVVTGRRGILDELDRYSGHVSAAQFREMNEQQSGSYDGIGVTVIPHVEGLLIMSVRGEGPAAEAGLLTGDIVVLADSVSLAELSPQEASSLLRGEDGTTVALEVYRPADSDTLSVIVTRRHIAYAHVIYAGYTPDSMVYIRLVDFDPGASADVKAALDSLVRDGPTSPRGLILDLKGNPGGLFSEAFEIADLFLNEGVFIVGTDGRSRWNDQEFGATGKDLTDNLPLVVLVNSGSASSSEIVAGALQSAGRAVLIGDTTFGKGLVQGYVRFPERDGLRLTISRYYFDGGVYLNDFDSALNDVGHGLVPDYCFAFGESHEFPGVLERSLLLHQYAYRHQDEIIAGAGQPGPDSTWTAGLIAFGDSAGFEWESRVAKRARGLKDLTLSQDYLPETRRLAERLLTMAQQDDRRQFQVHRTYIEARLRQFAFERKFSTYDAYNEVVVRERPDIGFAAGLMPRRE